MNKVLLLVGVAFVVASCGADGAPSKPEVGVSTSVGVNSKSGPYSDTNISIHFPAN